MVSNFRGGNFSASMIFDTLGGDGAHMSIVSLTGDNIFTSFSGPSSFFFSSSSIVIISVVIGITSLILSILSSFELEYVSSDEMSANYKKLIYHLLLNNKYKLIS